jgi:hypothetical protein
LEINFIIRERKNNDEFETKIIKEEDCEERN